MRMLIAIALGCALALGVSQAASPGAAQPASVPSAPAVEDTTDDAPPDIETGYECKYSPYCQRASQCTVYCGGGGAVCSQGCCACAS